MKVVRLFLSFGKMDCFNHAYEIEGVGFSKLWVYQRVGCMVFDLFEG